MLVLTANINGAMSTQSGGATSTRRNATLRSIKFVLNSNFPNPHADPNQFQQRNIPSITLVQDTRGIFPSLSKNHVAINSLNETYKHRTAGGVAIILGGSIAKLPIEILYCEERSLLAVLLRASNASFLVITAYLPGPPSSSSNINSFYNYCSKTYNSQNAALVMLQIITNLIDDHPGAIAIIGGDFNFDINAIASAKKAAIANLRNRNIIPLAPPLPIVPLPDPKIKSRATNVKRRPRKIKEKAIASSSSFPCDYTTCRGTTIDYILYTTCTDFVATGLRTVDIASDHSGVLGTFSVPFLRSHKKVGRPKRANTDWNLYRSLTSQVFDARIKDNRVWHTALVHSLPILRNICSTQPDRLVSLPYCDFTKRLRNICNLARKTVKRNKPTATARARLKKLESDAAGKLSVTFSRIFNLAITRLDEVLEPSNPRDAALVEINKLHKLSCRWLQTSFWIKQSNELSKEKRKRIRNFKSGKIKQDLKSIFRSGTVADSSILFIPKTSDPNDLVAIIGEDRTLPLLADHLSTIATNDTEINDHFRQRFLLANSELRRNPTKLSVSDLENQLKGMKSNTPGPSGFTVQTLKQLNDKDRRSFLESLLQLWEDKMVLEVYKRKNVTLLPKKPEPTIADFRPISLLEIGRKILLGALIRKYFVQEQLSSYQFGFRHGKSTDGACSELLSTLIDASKNKTPVVLCSLDFSKAFDSLPWSFLPDVLQEVGVPAEVTKFILDHEHEGSAFLSGEVSFSSSAGVPQGSIEGPAFWNAFINTLLRRFDVIRENHESDYLHTAHITFADDITLLAKTREGMERLIDEVNTFCNFTGMKLSTSKCFVSRNKFYKGGTTFGAIPEKGRKPIFILGRSIQMDPCEKNGLYSYRHEKAIKKFNNAIGKLKLLYRRSIDAHMTRQAVISVLIPQLTYLFKFDHNAKELVDKFDKEYNKLMKRKLTLARTFPNTVVFFPLGSAKNGIRPLFSQLLTSRLATVQRLSWVIKNHESDRRLELLNKQLNLSTIISPSGLDHNPMFKYKSEDIMGALNYNFPPTDLDRKGKLECSGFVKVKDGEKILNLSFRAGSSSSFAWEGTIPWPLDIKDKLRCELSALVVCSRFNFLRQWKHRRKIFDAEGNEKAFSVTLEPIVFVARYIKPSSTITPRVFKKVTSLGIANSDLLGDIFYTNQIVTHIKKVKHLRRLVTQRETDQVMFIQNLVTSHVYYGHTKNKIKENIAEVEFFNYLKERQEKYEHNGPYNWTRMLTPHLRLGWLDGSLRNITHLKVLLDHTPYGGLLKRRKYVYQPKRPKKKPFDHIVEAEKEKEIGRTLRASDLRIYDHSAEESTSPDHDFSDTIDSPSSPFFPDIPRETAFLKENEWMSLLNRAREEEERSGVEETKGCDDLDHKLLWLYYWKAIDEGNLYYSSPKPIPLHSSPEILKSILAKANTVPQTNSEHASTKSKYSKSKVKDAMNIEEEAEAVDEVQTINPSISRSKRTLTDEPPLLKPLKKAKKEINKKKRLKKKLLSKDQLEQSIPSLTTKNKKSRNHLAHEPSKQPETEGSSSTTSSKSALSLRDKDFDLLERKAKAKRFINQWKMIEKRRAGKEEIAKEERKEETEVEEEMKEEAIFHCRFCNEEIETRLHWLDQCKAYQTNILKSLPQEVRKLLPEGKVRQRIILQCTKEVQIEIDSILNEEVKAHALTGFFQRDFISRFFAVEIRSFKYIKTARTVIYQAIKNLAIARWRERAELLEQLEIQNEMANRLYHRKHPP